MQVSHAPTETAESATADVPFATTAHSILLIATRTKLLRSSLKKERCFSQQISRNALFGILSGIHKHVWEYRAA